MGNLVIRDELLEKVEAFAHLRGIDLEQRAEELLEQSLARRPSQAQLRELFEAIASLTPTDLSQTYSLQSIRESRDR